ncbi:MAG TPA: NAD(P)/FAD-dependent oxidoreductase [Nostocaceae cyanobacterium]|nr:NAD(P)/FAD-dependent oxidoreductase [Nostocaceae cyanobacterium]
MAEPYRVVIIGAGFAGLQVAEHLANTNLEVVLIDRKNYHTFQPLLHQVATAELEPEQIAYPIRLLLRNARNIHFLMADVQHIKVAERIVVTDYGWFKYDYLVLATGSTTQTKKVPGVASHTFTLKTLEDAVNLHHQILRCFERAMQEPNHELRQSLLTFVIVGGGATGVELASSMAEWIRKTLVKDYSILDCQQIRLVLLHGGSSLLNSMHPRLQTYTQRHLKRLGIEVYLNTKVSEVLPGAVRIKTGDIFNAATVVWATGVTATFPQNMGELPITKNQQILVLPTLQVVGHENLYAIGDIAAIDSDRQPLPRLAAVAVQQGKFVADNLKRRARGLKPLTFHYRDFGSMVILGRHAAAVQFKSWIFTGFTAWLLWLIVHFVLLRGFRQRWMALFNWLLSYCLNERVARIILHAPRTEKFLSNSSI